ncbi:MAG: sensor histidine kinase [Clostridia bacterium]|nr:sensor histidine kinase [Clostridia bacterium]
MDEKTESTLIKVLYASLFVVLIFVTIRNLKDPWLVILFSGLLITSVTIRNAVVYNTSNYSIIGRIMILVDVVLIFFIGLADISGKYSIYYFIIIGDTVLAFSYLFSCSIAVLSYISYGIGNYIYTGYPPAKAFLMEMAFNSLAFIAVTAVMIVVKYEMKQRNLLRITMTELKNKKKQLENTFVKLKKTSEDLEEMTIMKERNRIAREIHDTVGHTLTTVLLEMEAGERLIPVNPGLAAEKIQLAKGQIRKGLNDIRESVRMLQTGREILEFVPSLKLLIDETTKHGEVFIKYDISEIPTLTGKQEKAIYRALQEGLTNGIRHGKSTAFVFILKYENGHIKFFLQDNGTGTDKIVQGFGLTAMEERVKELGGVFSIDSEPGEGCCIAINIPVEGEGLNDGYKSTDS